MSPPGQRSVSSGSGAKDSATSSRTSRSHHSAPTPRPGSRVGYADALAHPGGPKAGFTLIELLICSAIAMVLAGFCVSTFYQFRKVVVRAESRQAMYGTAQNTYAYLQRTLSSVQQSCAFAVTRVQRDVLLDPDPGEIRVAFMRGKESIDSFRGFDSANKVFSDLTWELWVWNRANQTLSIANNSIGDATNPGRAFQSGAFSPAGVSYNGKWFHVTPQARRTLNPADPFGAGAGSLDDNILFPNASGVSMASPLGDIGDYTDLVNNLAVVLENVSDLSFELVTHSGAVHVVDDSAAAAPLVFQGVWLDGRLAPTLTAAPIYATSDLARRPRLLRLRYTVTDPRWRNDAAPLSTTFSFSFALPGLSAHQ